MSILDYLGIAGLIVLTYLCADALLVKWINYGKRAK